MLGPRIFPTEVILEKGLVSLNIGLQNTLCLAQRWKNIQAFLSLLKYVLNFTLFCRKSELCCNFALIGVILMDFNLVSFYF